MLCSRKDKMREETLCVCISKELGFENLKVCYIAAVFAHGACFFGKSAYLCSVFFIVLDLRLTKVGIRRDPFFYALRFGGLVMSF